MSGRHKIRPPKRLTAHDDFDACWELIKKALVDIHNRDAGNLSFEHLYRASYKIVLKKKGEILYNNVVEFEEAWFTEKIVPVIRGLITRNLVATTLHAVPGTSIQESRALGETFLKGIKESWEIHNFAMGLVADVLMYLDRAWLIEHKKPSIYIVTIGLFLTKVLRTYLPRIDQNNDDPGKIFDLLNAIIIEQVDAERNGEIINRSLIRNCIAMLEALHESPNELPHERIYLTSFQKFYLDQSSAYYQRECQQLLRDGDARAWLRQTQRRLKEETERCQTTLSKLTEPEIAQIVDDELIRNSLGDFLALEGSGIRSMIDNDRVDDLAILYNLISRIDPDKSALQNALSQRITDLGREVEQSIRDTDFSTAVAPAETGAAGDGAAEGAKKPRINQAAQQTAMAVKWVSDILALKEKFDKLWRDAFCEDRVINEAVTKSFGDLFKDCTRSSEYVSLFIDDLFRRGLRGKTDAEVESSLDLALSMIRHIMDKDMFQRYYQKHLARRLLHDKTENPEAEKSMLGKMQQDMGKTFTSKFEGMFKDMATSIDLNREYQQHLETSDSDSKMGLSVTVLTTNSWPQEVLGRAREVECNYPKEIQQAQKSFLAFYSKDRTGRILSWNGQAGTADIKCIFPAIAGEKALLSKVRQYEINVSTYMMVVMMLFNDIDENASLTVEEIGLQTGIPKEQLFRTLQSFLPPKARVLLKKPLTPEVKDGDKFSFNRRFVSKLVKFTIKAVAASARVEGDQERKETEAKNNQDRSHNIDAAIVRIMKQRKTLSHTDLITEVIHQLKARFKPDITMVKKRIEDLLNREYLERIDGEGPQMYRYLS